MSEDPEFPPSLVKAPGWSDREMQANERKPITGYVRCDIAHLNTAWHFDVLDEPIRVGLLVAETSEGRLKFGMNREAAIELKQQLELFLADMPEGGESS